jgi:hypothetical protein
MRATQKYSAILSLAAGVVTSIAVAPLAIADDAMPTAGQIPRTSHPGLGVRGIHRRVQLDEGLSRGPVVPVHTG